MVRSSVLVVVATAAACSSSGPTTTSGRPSASPSPPYVVAKIAVGAKPCAVLGGFDSVWVSVYGDDRALTNKTTTLKVGVNPTGIAPAGGAVWVSNQADSTVSRIDPRTLRVRTTKFGLSPSWASWGTGQAWFSDVRDIEQVDLRTCRRGKHVELSGQLNDGDVVGGRLWIADAGGTLSAVSTKDGRRIGSWPIGLGNPFVLDGYRGKLWIVDYKGVLLEEVDPAALT
jgi:streptogramin lyase